MAEPIILPFRLHPFARGMWTNPAAQAEWEPRLARARFLMADLRWRSVGWQRRSAALLRLTHAEAVYVAAQLPRYSLALMPLDGHPTGPASKYLVGSPQAQRMYLDARTAGAADDMQRLLGVPDCCNAASARREAMGLYDRAWSAHTDAGTCNVTELSTAAISPLFHAIGLTFVDHAMCSYECEATRTYVGQLLEGVTKWRAALGDDVAWAVEFLAANASWSSLHGIAEVANGLIKVAYSTDAIGARVDIAWTTGHSPRESAHGLVFPFVAPTRPQLAQTSGYKRGIEHNLVSLGRKPTQQKSESKFAEVHDEQ